MISTIHTILQRLGRIDVGTVCPFNAAFLRLQFFQLFLPDGSSVAVKVAGDDPVNLASIEHEYDALLQQSNLYPGLVPAPILLETFGRNSFLFTEGVEHRSARFSDVFVTEPGVHSCFSAFLVGQERIAGASDQLKANHIIDLDRAMESIDDPRLRQLFGDKRNAWNAMLSTLPQIPQHSDLSINNIGVTPNGLIVFDWEDYGRISLPGFDLCVLIASANGFEYDSIAILLNAATEQEQNSSNLLSDIIDRSPFSAKSITDIFLISMVLFHHLKVELGYGDGVIKAVHKLLQQFGNRM